VSIRTKEEHEMKKLIVTLALAASTFTAAGAAAVDPGSNVCHRLRYAIASGTPASALPPSLLRRCFGPNAPVRPTAITSARPSPVATSRGH
jgi:hypothetical protein